MLLVISFFDCLLFFKYTTDFWCFYAMRMQVFEFILMSMRRSHFGVKSTHNWGIVWYVNGKFHPWLSLGYRMQVYTYRVTKMQYAASHGIRWLSNLYIIYMYIVYLFIPYLVDMADDAGPCYPRSDEQILFHVLSAWKSLHDNRKGNWLRCALQIANYS